jgi:hypothetical protein
LLFFVYCFLLPPLTAQPQQSESQCISAIQSLLGPTATQATPEGKARAQALIEAILLGQLRAENDKATVSHVAWRMDERGQSEADREKYDHFSFAVGYTFFLYFLLSLFSNLICPIWN